MLWRAQRDIGCKLCSLCQRGNPKTLIYNCTGREQRAHSKIHRPQKCGAIRRQRQTAAARHHTRVAPRQVGAHAVQFPTHQVVVVVITQHQNRLVVGQRQFGRSKLLVKRGHFHAPVKPRQIAHITKNYCANQSKRNPAQPALL